MTIKQVYIYFRAIPKTVYFNFKYLKFRNALKFPVIVSHNVWLKNTKGKIILNFPIKTGIVRLGFGDIGIFDFHHSRTIWEVNGEVIFNGRANIGHGSKICVKGQLSIGNNTIISAESTIVCYERVTIGDDCLLSWDILIMDTDFHRIKTLDGTIVNHNKEVHIGNNVWIGCRCLVLKGVVVQDGNVIASNTTMTKSLEGHNQIIGGNPPNILRERITWES